MQAIVLIVVLYLLYQLVVFLFNSGLLLITVIILLAIFILWIYIGANNAVNKEKWEKEKLSSLEDEWNSKYEIWKEDNSDLLKIQVVYEEKKYSKISLGYQFNEIALKIEKIKKKQESKNITQNEKEELKIERKFLRKIVELAIEDVFWKNDNGAYKIFYIFVENSILKIREKIIFGSEYKNENLDIRIRDMYYYQESGKIETRERTTGYVRQSKSPGVIESAIVGGLIAGSTGAVVGGMSGMKNSNRGSSEYTTTEYNDKRGIMIFYKDEEGKNKMYEFKRLKNYNATWKILIELIPEKSYENVALQNGEFHLLNK